MPFCFFLYEKRLVSLRRSPRFSTMIALFLYESLSACFQYFTPPFFSPCLFLPVLSKSLPFHLKYLLLPLSFLSFFFFFLSRAFICARIYYNVPPFFFFFSSFHFYVLQHLCKSASYKKFPFYSKIIPDIFCLYCKKVYFCIRLARGAKLLSLT